MSKRIKSIILFIFLIGLISQVCFPNIVYAISIYNPDPDITNPKIKELQESLLKSPNFLQYTEYKMLKYKNNYISSDPYYYGDYDLKPTGPSPLSKEFRGTLTRDSHYWFTEGVDLLTGSRAIDESLQLGSIGAERENFQTQNDRSSIEYALSRFYKDNKYYPLTLEDLRPKYISRIPTNFSYKRTGNFYELKFITSVKSNIRISDIEPLSIKSHPWQEMINGQKPTLPAIFSVVPADYFMVYFKDVSRVEEFEKAIQSMAGPAKSLYGLEDTPQIKNLIFERLKIKDIKELRIFIDDAVLVSYDLEFLPHTDYALILKLKSTKLNDFVSSFVQAPADRHGKVGDYYVIATDSSMYQKIASMPGNRSSSLIESPDVLYVTSVLEQNYDIFAYFSEAFIQKLTSPSYRINARRRNTILNALETIQYMVFAYRDITGKWPSSVKQIINEGYIAPNSIANIDDYSIDSNGIVKHKIWNTIYDVTTISQVPVDEVFPAEKSFYDNFRQGYEGYWREFIDPVGIAIIIGDQIRFHTVILPLIDESNYNWIKDIAGSDPIEFDFISNPDRASSLQFVLKLNLEDILYAIFKEAGPYLDEDYNKCVDDYYDNYTKYKNSSLSDVCKPKEKTKEEAIKYIKEKLAETLEWKETKDILSFVGNEITISTGDSLAFKTNDFSNLDISLGIELADTELAKKFLDSIFKWYGRQMSEYSYSGSDFFSGEGMFRSFISTSEPIKNEYNGVEFYIVPTFFTNIYYTFLNNRFYLTVSQKAMNKLIDGSKTPEKWNSQMIRLFEYLGNEQNAMFIADGSKLETWLKGLIRDQWLSSGGATEFKQFLGYYTEALALAKTLPGYNGSISNVTQTYYKHAPIQWFDANFATHDGSCYLVAGGKEYDAYNIETKRSSYSSLGKEEDKGKVKLEEIAKNFNIDAAFAKWEAAKSFGVGLKFTKEGLDIMASFNNPGRKEFDPRIPSVLPSPVKKTFIYYGIGIIVLIIIILFSVSVIVKRRRLKQSDFYRSSIEGPALPKEEPPKEIN